MRDLPRKIWPERSVMELPSRNTLVASMGMRGGTSAWPRAEHWTMLEDQVESW